MGASLAKEVAAKVKEKSGDGTTTATLLLKALVQQGLKNVSSGASPINLKRGIDKAVEAVTAALDKASFPVKGSEAIGNVATVSASGNEKIGQTIAEAFAKVGKDGVITIEEGKSTETQIEMVEGMQFDRGYISAYFVTHSDSMSIEMRNPSILVTEKKISSVQEILNLLQSIAAASKELLIIADDVEGECLSTLVVNRLRGTLKVAAVKAPGFGDRRKAMLQDIAILTGAQLISEDTGSQLRDADASVLGTCEKIVVTKDHTTIVGGKGDSEQIKARIKQIDKEAEKASNSYDKEKLQERKAKLSGGVAVIKVGSISESEMKHRKQAFEDSLNSTRAAMEEGVVAGGGTALLNAAKAIEALGLQGDEAIGAKIVALACEAPFRQIAFNTGFDGAVVLSQVRAQSNPNVGFNARSEKVEDLIAAGVIDPTKVVKNCLIYAASVASVVLLSEALITEAQEDEQD
jgi:chaperonin GroEL